jgi:hypothetical protein
MLCRHCGIEIADKALICYRCGHATAEPVHKPAATPPPATRLIPLLALVALVLAGLYLGQAGTGQVPSEVSYTIAAIAAVVLAWRQWQRFSRRR